MTEIRLLEQGLRLISQCRAATGDIWHAHFGAAGIAAYFFTKDNPLPAHVYRAVMAQAEAMLKERALPGGGHAQARRTAAGDAESAILAALDRTIDGLHWVGHNVIYAALSLMAIRELGSWGSNEELHGITDLLLAFERTIPGRSWIGYSAPEVKRLDIQALPGYPVMDRADELSAFILEELAAFRTIYRAEAHHDLIGHLLTYSHALNVLYDLGYADYFRRGLAPVMKLAYVLRASRDEPGGAEVQLTSPVDRLPLAPALRSPYLPHEPAYWGELSEKPDWEFGHRFKFPYSFYDHLRRAQGKREKAVENFRYVVGR